jgi:uncharacterized small protein (DUF1192 family)
MSDVHELRQRREALEAELSVLSEQREHAFRVNSDARALQHAGVTHHDQAEMKGFADNEIAGDSAMTDLRRRIAQIDDEIARDHAGGLPRNRRTIMRWLRK